MQDKNRPLRLLMLLSLTLLATGCASKLESWQPRQVVCPAIPELPNEARQPPAPPWCSPTCSAGLTRERESWQRLMTNPE
ncbi:putative phosphodiesterase [Pseudomonas phage MR15]|uniref:Putative phosphodiesterase n=1 Tax=Pseudomonas phage MR15 TaxID=2711179 RepID=A0A6M3TDW1_9CAUD|nr:putative phosphodiesterase [Pseudomonas phage MR15]QJD55078.1 putative phosphoribosyl 1,2-cyclic phosphodiesterase [Pseudomonas phage MR13]QJD55230.1 putative phosphodiesterase [Pseudomonas phage MR15]